MEPSFGWTTDMNQIVAMQPSSEPWADPEGEPSLGWTMHGYGHVDGETTVDLEQDQDSEPSLGWSTPGGQGPIVGVTIRYDEVQGESCE